MRLYYEKKFRQVQPQSRAVDPPNADEYLTKVAQLVPSEIIAGYLTMTGFASAIENKSGQQIAIWLVFLLGLVLTPLYLNKAATAGLPKRNHLIVSSVAFVVWAYVTTGEQLMASLGFEFQQAIASIILVGFTLVSGLIPLDK